MELKRVIDLPTTADASRVYARLKKGTMTYYEDDKGYVCYDQDELETYTPSKRGRPSKIQRKKV